MLRSRTPCLGNLHFLSPRTVGTSVLGRVSVSAVLSRLSHVRGPGDQDCEAASQSKQCRAAAGEGWPVSSTLDTLPTSSLVEMLLGPKRKHKPLPPVSPEGPLPPPPTPPSFPGTLDLPHDLAARPCLAQQGLRQSLKNIASAGVRQSVSPVPALRSPSPLCCPLKVPGPQRLLIRIEPGMRSSPPRECLGTSPS